MLSVRPFEQLVYPLLESLEHLGLVVNQTCLPIEHRGVVKRHLRQRHGRAVGVRPETETVDVIVDLLYDMPVERLFVLPHRKLESLRVGYFDCYPMFFLLVHHAGQRDC